MPGIGDASWAVITGGTDGIGWELAQQLAAISYNICIIARNEEKLKKKIAELKEKFPNCMTKSIVCDFAKISTLAEYRAAIQHQVSKLGDISLVALNAGVIRVGLSHNLTDEAVEEVVRVNALHVCFASKIFLEILTKR